jgi:integrase
MGKHTRNVLTVKSIAANKATKLRDGGGLWLVTKGGDRYWIFDYRIAGKRREMGVGPLHTVGLAEARQRAERAREHLRRGIDPIAQRTVEAIEAAKAKDGVVTFGKYADAYIDGAVKARRWSGAKTEANWRNSIKNHAKAIRDKDIAGIGVADVLSVLTPIWAAKPESADKLRARIETILAAAKVEGLRSGDNPAAWKDNLEHAALHREEVIEDEIHHPAVPWQALPDVMKSVRSVGTISSAAAEFCILTASRPGMVRHAVWSDFVDDVWIIVARGMKGRKEHRVPLSPRALEILKAMKAKRLNDYVFPGVKAKRPLSENTLTKTFVTSGGEGFTVHGTARSSFRDWVRDTGRDEVLGELALAHKVGNAVQRAYARSDAFDRRRDLMNDWAKYLGGESPAKN